MINLRDVARELNDAPVADPTPVASVYRRANALRRRARLVRAGTGALAVGAAVVIAVAVISTQHRDKGVGTTPATQPTSSAALGWPSDFVSTRLDPSGRSIVIAASDAHTGAIVKTIAEIRASVGTNVTGTAIAPDGHVWVTINRGPGSGSGVNGGDPQPHSCSSEVRDYDPSNGKFTTVLRGGDDDLISDAQPSRSGESVAYTYSGCATSYFDNSIQVKNLATGAVVTIGASLPRCHLIEDPRWTQDGTGLVFSYAPASTGDYSGPNGSCSEVVAGTIVRVSAEHSQSGVEGSTATADPGCSINAVTVTNGGYAALEHCGTTDFINGPVKLLRYDADLRPVTRVSIGDCENGASVAGTTKSSDVIISMYQFCGGDATPGPTTNVFVDDKNGVHGLLSISGGSTALDHLSY
jgi:hypothetical protein